MIPSSTYWQESTSLWHSSVRLARLIDSVLNIFYLLDECLHAYVVCVHSGDAGVDVVEVLNVVNQLVGVLDVPEVGSRGAGPISIWIGGICCAQWEQGEC